MNQVTPESKNAAIKTLAILGFIVMIIIALWVAVQIVRMIPGAFSQLANLADDLHNGNEIVIEEETIVANSSETVSIDFNGVNEEGVYTFSYECADGIAVAFLLENTKEFIACDEAYELEGSNSIELSVSSEKNRFTDVNYTITFTPASGEEEIASSGKLTIVNNAIPTGVAVNDEDEEEAEEEDTTPTPTRPTTPSTPVKPTPAKPVTTITYVSQIPQSDPKGFTDLAISFISSKSFDADDDATFQIEVKNLGTKTSKEFDITLELPEGIEHEIRNEKGLKPNERAVYTIEFDARDMEGSETIEGEVDVDDDTKSSNDSFRTSVRIDD